MSLVNSLARLERLYPDHSAELSQLRTKLRNGHDITDDITRFRNANSQTRKLKPYTTYLDPQLPDRIAKAAKAAGKPKYQYLTELLTSVVP